MTADPATAAVRAAWADALELGGGEFGGDDDFFALGGDSVSAALVSRCVARATGAHIPPRALFEQPTLVGFVDLVRRLSSAAQATVPRRPNPDQHPLAPGQERQWLLNQLHPTRTTYTVPTIVELDGPLDLRALSVAMAALVDRHEPLRTLVDDTRGPARAHVTAAGAVPIETVDLRTGDRSAELPRAAAARAADAFLHRPFALDRDVPFRAQLIRLTAHRSWLVLAVHHIAIDGEGQRILLAELGALYSGRELPPVTASYGDLAFRWASSAPDRTASSPAPHGDRSLALEGDHPEHPSGVGARHVRRLGERLADEVRACASGLRTTVFVVLLAAFTDIVARWSDSPQVCVGFPVSSREDDAARDLIGFFVETCVLHVDLSDQPSCRTVVERVHSEVVAAMAGSTPFDAFAQASASRGEGSSVFRTWFNHPGPPLTPPDMRGLRTAMVDAPSPAALFDLNLYVVETPTDIRIDVIRDVAVAGGDAVERLLDQYVALLEHAVAAVDERLRHRAPAAALPDPADPLTTPSPVPGLARRLLAVARAHPDATAVGGHSYAGLRTSVRGVVHELRRAGVHRGATVAVLARREPDLVVAVLGVWAAGSRLLILDPALPTRRLAGQLTAADASCLLGDAVPDELDDTGRGLVRLHGGTAALVRTAAEPRGGAAGSYVAFTSGSTGAPVGVQGTVGPITHFLHWYSTRCGLSSSDRFALLAGLSHDPVYRDLLLPLWNGAELFIPPADVARVPVELVRWLREQRISVAHLTPALARLLAAEGVSLPDLRILCLSGDAVRAEDVAQLAALAPGATLLLGYGTTETPQLVSLSELAPGRPPSLAAQAPGSQLLVLDDAGDLCGIGETGRIVVRSRHLASPLAAGTAAAATRGALGWSGDAVPGVRRFDTGDLGRYRSDGSVTFLGRRDDVVSIHGFRAHPAETDRALAADPRVRSSFTVALPAADSTGSTELVSYVVCDGVAPSELRRALAAQLPPYQVPARVLPVASLPLTGNGKVDRAALPSPRPEPPPTPAAAQPTGPLETRVAALLADILGRAGTDVTQTFFDLGASSVHLLRLHSAIRRQLATEVPLLTLYENPTIRTLARALGDGAEVSTAPSIHNQERGSRYAERTRRLAARRAAAVAGPGAG